jgi:hypothetical protein
MADPSTPPPAYASASQHSVKTAIVASTTEVSNEAWATDQPDIVSAFANLNLGSRRRTPTVDECIAQLKLLEAIQQLRDDVGRTDGLYGLFDRLADGSRDPVKVHTKICQKRWAIFVTQAAWRFEAWFHAIEKSHGMCTWPIMQSPQYAHIHEASRPLNFDRSSLPPLGT